MEEEDEEKWEVMTLEERKGRRYERRSSNIPSPLEEKRKREREKEKRKKGEKGKKRIIRKRKTMKWRKGKGKK